MGDLLREKLGEDVESYVFPDDFEKAVANIGFRALTAVGEPPVYDKLVCIGDGLALLSGMSINGTSQASFKEIQFIAPTFSKIPSYAFYRNASLETITIPDSVSTIGNCALNTCTALENIIIPDSVTDIGQSMFQGDPSLSHLRLPKSFQCGSGSGSPFANSSHKMITCGPENSNTDYDIELGNGITVIPNSLFYASKGIKTVVIPDTVTGIYANAFYNCVDLENITIPNSVTSIGGSVFYGCSSLLSVSINGVSSINYGDSSGMFHGCSSMTSFSATSLNSLTCGTTDNNSAFYNCSSMTTCNLGSVGNPLTFVSNNAFKNCTNTSLVITVYTDENNLDDVLANIRNGATNATIIMKAAADMEYNGTSYSAGETVVTSTP